jgi:hypothetical protein
MAMDWFHDSSSVRSVGGEGSPRARRCLGTLEYASVVVRGEKRLDLDLPLQKVARRQQRDVTIARDKASRVGGHLRLGSGCVVGDGSPSRLLHTRVQQVMGLPTAPGAPSSATVRDPPA